MAHIPIPTLNMSQFSLDTGFDSTPGVQDPVYNPRILDGVELHQFFTRQVHLNGRNIEGITVDTNGIVFPQGYSYILDPMMYYSSGTTWYHSPHFRWIIDGVEQENPKFASHYASDTIGTNLGEANGRGYRGLIYLDCSLASKTVKIVARSSFWNDMGNVYFDNQQTNAVITSTHKSHILCYAIPSADISNPTVRQLDTTWQVINGWNQTADAILPTNVSQLPADALNKYIVFARDVAGTWTYSTPLNPQVGDWLGVMITNATTNSFFVLTCQSPAQTLVASSIGRGLETCYMFVWTGNLWKRIPFSEKGLVKLRRVY